ncbi:TPA: EpsG family protein [Streptococcus suis]
MIEILPYLFTYGIVVFLLTFPTNDRLVRIASTFVAIMIVFIFSGGRYLVGTDSITYHHIFERLATSPWEDLLLGDLKEILFSIIAKSSYSIGGLFLTQGVFGLLTFCPVYLTLKNHYQQIPLRYSLSIFLLIFFTTSFNILRQMVAVSIVFSGIKYLERGQLIRFLLTILLAFGFHSSAIFSLILFFIWNTKEKKVRSKVILCIFWLLSFTIMLFFRNSLLAFIELFEDYSSYTTSEIAGKNRDFILYIVEMIYVSVVLLGRRKSEHTVLLYQMMLMVVLIGLTGFFSPYIKRLGLYFSLPSRLLLIPEMENYFIANNKIILRVFGYSWFILIFIITVYLLKQGHLIPYRFNIVWK